MAQKTKKPGKKSRNVKTKRRLHKLMGDIFNALGMKHGDAGPLVMRNGVNVSLHLPAEAKKRLLP